MKYQYHRFLESASRSFLDRHYPEDFPDDPETFDKAVEELVVHLDAKLWDEWPGIRDEMQQKLEGHPPIPPERVQEVKDAVAQQLQDFADAGHPDPEEAMAEAEARGAGA